ncbi:NUDIX domain-containing protein [Enterococcus sp. NPDC086594]|uniref:NUDIX domain-containing protein n=1 Tax=Enterococcus sp. NPDC086594 TaxID=3363992 RepID=UPI00382461D8
MANKVSEEEMNEEEWLNWYKKQELPQYPKPAFTVDNLIFNVTSDAVYILLVKRKNHPFKGRFALPGGFVNEGENIIKAAIRELKEETGVEVQEVSLLGVYGDKNRDPRGWTVSAVYITVLQQMKILYAGDDASEAFWYRVDKDKVLYQYVTSKERSSTENWESLFAFDHAQIIHDGFKWLNDELRQRGL